MLSVSSHAAFLGTSSFFHLNGPLWPFFFFICSAARRQSVALASNGSKASLLLSKYFGGEEPCTFWIKIPFKE